MQVSIRIKGMLAALFLLFMASCNPKASNDKVAKDSGPVMDSSDAPSSNPVTVLPKPGLDGLRGNYCYRNDGLKYSTTITMSIVESKVVGRVVSGEYDSKESESTNFDGTVSGDKLTIHFKETAPVMGAASEWTDKPWTLKKEGNDQTLLIVFNAKDYETNKWSETEYEFKAVTCK